MIETTLGNGFNKQIPSELKFPYVLRKEHKNIINPTGFKTYDNGEVTKNQKYLVVYIPIESFNSSIIHNGLFDISNDAGKVAPANMVRLLMTMVSGFNQLKTEEKKKKHKKQKLVNDESESVHELQEAEGEKSEEEEEVEEEEKHSFYWFVYNEEVYQKLEVFFEIIKDNNNKLIGYRYWFVTLYQSLDFNSLILNACRNKKKIIPLYDCEVIHKLHSVKDWNDYFVTPYTMKICDPVMILKDLSDKNNELNIYNVLSFTNSLTENICEQQSNSSNYFDDDGKLYQFPVPVTQIPINQVSHIHSQICEFPINTEGEEEEEEEEGEAEVAEERSDGEEEEEEDEYEKAILLEELKKQKEIKHNNNLIKAEIKLNEIVNILQYYPQDTIKVCNSDKDEFESLKDIIIKKRESSHCKLNVNFRKSLEKNKKIFKKFNLACRPERNTNDTYKSIFTFGINNINKMNKYPTPSIIDDELSVFGNNMLALMDIYEKDGINNLHVYLLLTFFVAISAIYPLEKSQMPCHMGISGAKSTGKSFILSYLNDSLLIPGVSMMCAKITRAAFSSQSNKKNNVVIFDEIPKEYLGINRGADGKYTNDGGDEVIKSILTGIPGTALSPNIENGERKMVETSLDNRRIFIGAFNKYCFLIALVYAARWLLIDVPDIPRGGSVVNNAGSSYVDDKDVKVKNDFHKMIQFIYAQVCLCIYVGLIPQPDISCGILLFREVLPKLKSIGFTIEENRDFQRLCNMTLTLTIIHAIFQKYFKCPVEKRPEIKFEVDYEFLNIQDYMCCTEEIAIYVLTALSSQYINTTEYIVVKEIISLFEYKDNDDYQYYSSNVASTNLNVNIIKKSMISELVNKVQYRLTQKNINIDEAMIIQIFEVILKRKMDVSSLNSNDSIFNSAAPVAVVAAAAEGGGGDVNKHCSVFELDVGNNKIKILNLYKKLIEAQSYEDLLIKLIKQSSNYNETEERTVITAFRHSTENPNKFKTVELKRDMNVIRKNLLKYKKQTVNEIERRKSYDDEVFEEVDAEFTEIFAEFNEEEEEATPPKQKYTVSEERKKYEQEYIYTNVDDYFMFNHLNNNGYFGIPSCSDSMNANRKKIYKNVFKPTLKKI